MLLIILSTITHSLVFGLFFSTQLAGVPSIGSEVIQNVTLKDCMPLPSRKSHLPFFNSSNEGNGYTKNHSGA